jgi:hydroxyacylglutathione hydrolase
MLLKQITDEALAQNAYLIGCQRSGEAIVIDPERDVDRYLELARKNGLRLTKVADTHIHADYLSGARELVEQHGAHGYFSAEGGEDWQFEWAHGLDGTTLLRDGDSFEVGKIEIRALLTPGHTPEHLSFLVIDHGGGADEPMALLSGDFIFVGDVGRPDLLESAAGETGAMEPAARTLFESLRQTRELPGFLQVLPAHGAGSSCGKALGAIPSSVLEYERRHNSALQLALDGERDEFVETILSGQPEPPFYFARMKRDNRRGPALLPDGKLPSPKRISPNELPSWVGVGGNAILDLRQDRQAFMARHLKGSLLTPLTGTQFSEAAGSYVKESDRILVLVERESDLEAAVRNLVRIGLDRIEAWMPVGEALEATEATGLTDSIRRIGGEDLEEELRSDSGVAVLDVRGTDEFAAKHLAGAANVAHTRLLPRLPEVPESDPLIVHCASGRRAAVASAFLAASGRSVTYLDGDFDEFPEHLLE